MALKWYVVHTYSGFEGKVKRSLEERIETSEMKEYFAVLIPEEAIVELSMREEDSIRKFFPGSFSSHGNEC